VLIHIGQLLTPENLNLLMRMTVCGRGMFVARLTMFVSRRCVRFGVFMLALCMVMRRLKVMMGCGVVSGSRGVMMLDGRVLRCLCHPVGYSMG